MLATNKYLDSNKTTNTKICESASQSNKRENSIS